MRNTPLAKNRPLIPLFEAVVNSLHSIEDATGSTDEGYVRIKVIRSDQSEMALDDSDQARPGPDPTPEIVGFEITDNGVGFTDDNLKSFVTLDSGYKSNRGCRGIGRLFWLVAFDHVSIKSVFESESGGLHLRTFDFTPDDGVTREECGPAPANAKRATTVTLRGFQSPYREATPKKLQSIARELLEHCLWYFIRVGGAPDITISDDSEKIDLEDVFASYMASDAKTEQIEVKGSTFDLIHVRLSVSVSAKHTITYCAANRPVKEESLSGKISGLSGALQFEGTPFRYSCFVTSPYLDEHVRPERLDFNIQDESSGLFQATEISFKDLRSALVTQIEGFLEIQLAENRKRAVERVEEFTSSKDPSYRPFVKHLPETGLDINPDISDKDLDLALHRVKYEVERSLRDEGHNLMVPRDDESEDQYKARISKYLEKLEDVKKSDLASYVSHRRVVLDLLEAALRLNREGKYEKEDVVHQLIMPMGKDSNELFSDNLNLWLIDERLAFHNYLASDKPIKSLPITDSQSPKEPDVVGLRMWDRPLLFSESTTTPRGSLVVIELKRPMRNNARPGEEHDPIEQALGYLNRIRKGQVKTYDGRPIMQSDSIPGFCYVICDITESVRERCLAHDAKPTPEGDGFFFYHSAYSAYVEVCSFDRLIDGAKQRNHAFFSKLGLPTK